MIQGRLLLGRGCYFNIVFDFRNFGTCQKNTLMCPVVSSMYAAEASAKNAAVNTYISN